MEAKKIKVGVVGVGSLGQHHARVYAEMPQAELVGVYDANKRRAAKHARKNGTRAFDTIEALAAEIEAASIVVPTDIHRAVAGDLLARGIHLLVEKPIATTTQEAQDLVQLAKANDVVLQVGHIERFNPVLATLENSDLPPRFIEAHRLSPYPPARKGLPPRGTEVSVVLDLMIHDIEIILHLVGAPLKSIAAVGMPVLSKTEDICNARLSFENGCVANVTASRISPERMRKIRVFREDAYISLDYMKQEGEMYTRGKTRINRKTIPVKKEEPLASELRAFVDCVATRGTPQVSGEQGAEALKIAMEIVGLCREGTPT
jgi:predicted dehydrogenase